MRTLPAEDQPLPKSYFNAPGLALCLGVMAAFIQDSFGYALGIAPLAIATILAIYSTVIWYRIIHPSILLFGFLSIDLFALLIISIQNV